MGRFRAISLALLVLIRPEAPRPKTFRDLVADGARRLKLEGRRRSKRWPDYAG